MFEERISANHFFKFIWGYYILEEVINKTFEGFFTQENFPERRVIKNETASYHGMAKLTKLKKYQINNSGIKIKYRIEKIYFKKTIFNNSGYFDAISTCIHELCHAFGGDSSQAFSNGLTVAMEVLMSNYTVIEEYQSKWKSLFFST